MAETLGSLCDKLTIVKLKQYHTSDQTRLTALASQERNLCAEIDVFARDAVAGSIPPERLSIPAHKVYKKEGNDFTPVSGGIGHVFAELASVNCQLWHEQEKVYEFEMVPAEQKDYVVKQLAILNLRRNQCIDAIDRQFLQTIADSSNQIRNV